MSNALSEARRRPLGSEHATTAALSLGAAVNGENHQQTAQKRETRLSVAHRKGPRLQHKRGDRKQTTLGWTRAREVTVFGAPRASAGDREGLPSTDRGLR